MTFSTTGGERVPAPACEKRPFGLVSVAEHDQRGDLGWARGLEFDEMACSGRPSAIAMPCPPPPEALVKAARRGYNTEDAAAFVVYEGWECSAGTFEVSQAWDNVEGLLERSWEWGLERAFWTGVDQGGNTIASSLAGGGAVDLTPVTGPLDVVAGIATLESYMADVVMCLPTIHANVGVGAFLQTNNLLAGHDSGALRLAPTGTKVALGGGYPDTGPAGDEPDAGAAWIFASGPVRVTSSPIFFTPERGDVAGAVTIGTTAETLEVGRAANDIVVYAEKMLAVQRACGLAAVQVVLSNCCQ
jgi:hypothetical protein